MARNPLDHRVLGPVLATGIVAAALCLPVAPPGPVGEQRAAAAPAAHGAADRAQRTGKAERAGARRRAAARFALDGPRGTAVLRNRRYVPLGPALDVYRRVGVAGPAPAVLVVHGGGWTGGSRARMAAVARGIARAGMVALNVGYTLAEPGWAAGYPRQPGELRAAVRWTRRNATRLGIDRRRIGVLGSSAGGHLAALLATGGQGALDGGARVAAAVTWSAPLDLSALAAHRLLGPAATALLGCAPDACPERWSEASPLAQVTPGDTPLLLVNSRSEMVPATQAELMAARLAASAVPHELWLLDGQQHGREYAHRALPRSIAFLRERLLP